MSKKIKKIILLMSISFGLYFLLISSTTGQIIDTKNIQTSTSKKLIVTNTLPSDWIDWTPEPNQFKLYINIVDGSDSTKPRLCILDNNDFSWPFDILFWRDTLYLDLVPPGYTLEETSVDSMPLEFPMVIRAGTERAIYWYSNDDGLIQIDTTLLSAPFIGLKTVNPLPSDLAYLYLPGSDNHAKIIRKAVKQFKSKHIATLIQLDDGFYQGLWDRVSKTTIQRFKINWVGLKTENVGALIVFKIANPNNRREVENILNDIAHH